ncbi:MAG: succinate dehydrogenase/fumarate reductase iron-sulfur subunit [Bacteroidota bacterium]
MRVNLRVQRHDPERRKTWQQTYTLEMPDYAVVLDALIQVREEIDESLALRCSCRSAICGSCAMRLNGHAKLACKTKVVDIVPQGETIMVEPMGNLPVIKDLVVDMKPFWDKVNNVEPWLQPAGPQPEHEYIVPNEAMLNLAGVMDCIMCGACVSDCTVLEAELKMAKPYEGTFLAPAALAKAYRFVADPRDATTTSRLEKLSEATGIWDCTRCMECVEVCPKGVAPMDRIMALREKAIELNITDNYGSKHSLAFAESIKHSGWLNEFSLLQKSFGPFNFKELLRLVPGGIRMVLRLKTPTPIHKPIPGVDRLRKLFEKFQRNPN